MTAGSFRRPTRGISLVEALVAMIVMSFGTLAVLGVQATLRANGDISKQRAEAVRIGQQALERWRAYTAMEGDDDDTVYFGDLADGEATVDGTNASYTVALGVPEETDAAPLRKTIVVDVSWTDRAGEAHAVRLRSALGGVPPELAGTLGLPTGRSVVRNPGGRHPTIPPDAQPIVGGRSRFTPPGAATGVSWVFDNNTGYIVQLCNTDGCAPFAGRLLAGFIRFSTDGPPDAEVPASPRIAELEVRVTQTFPLSLADNVVQCYEDLGPTAYMPYYCAMPIGDQASWSGRTRFLIPDAAATDEDPMIVRSVSSAAADRYKVCRYTPYRDGHPVVPTQMSNAEHPLDYVKVDVSLTNQNYLVIRAGDGASSYGCPNDDSGTPQVLGTTWFHDPATD